MAQLGSEQLDAIRAAVKDAVDQTLRDSRYYFRDVLVEALEDPRVVGVIRDALENIAMSSAVREGLKTELVPRQDVMDALDEPT